jgi:cell wall-associated NlpC family hydrolase
MAGAPLRDAGLAIPRTSQEQWAAGPRVAAGQEQPGDLVFFAGSDGTPQAPGHVGIVIDNGEMIEAYAAGFPVRVSTYGQPFSPAGDQVVVGSAVRCGLAAAPFRLSPPAIDGSSQEPSRGGGSVGICGSASRLCAGRRAGLAGSAICSWRFMRVPRSWRSSCHVEQAVTS